MPVYDAAGNPAAVYDAAGNAVTWYDAFGQVVNGGGAPIPPPNPLGPYAVNQYPERMGWWWEKREACIAGADTARVLISGNSLTAGYTASLTGATDHAQFRANGYVFKARDDVDGSLGQGGEGIIAFSDPRVSLSGSPTRITSYGPGLYAYRLTSGQSITITDVTETRIGVMWRHEVGQTQPPTVTIDGSPWTPTATGSATGDYVFDFIDGLSDTVHTVVIAGPASGRCDVSCLVAGSLDTVHRLSAPGGYVYNAFPMNSDGATEAEVFRNTLDALDIDLLALAYGHNEATREQSLGVAFTPTELAERYERVLDYQINTRGRAAAILAGPARSGVTGASTMDDYWDALRDLAASYPERCDFIDFRDVTGTTFVSSEFWDSVHPKIEMHDDMRKTVTASLFPTGAALEHRLEQVA